MASSKLKNDGKVDAQLHGNESFSATSSEASKAIAILVTNGIVSIGEVEDREEREISYKCLGAYVKNHLKEIFKVNKGIWSFSSDFQSPGAYGVRKP